MPGGKSAAAAAESTTVLVSVLSLALDLTSRANFAACAVEGEGPTGEERTLLARDEAGVVG